MSVIIPITLEDGTEEEVEVDGKDLSVEFGNIELQPTLVKEVTTDIEGNTNDITNQCGDTEVRKDGNTPWSLTAKGTIIEEELADLQSLGEFDEDVTATAPVLGDRSGTFIVPEGGVTIKDTHDVNFLRLRQGGDKHRAFEFRLELKQPES